MQTRHVLITLLVAAHILVALAVVAWAQMSGRLGGQILFSVVSVGQVGLLSIWTALGRSAAPWRPVALIATIVAWIWVGESKTGGGVDPYLLVLFLLVAATTVAIFAAARGFGLRLFLPGVDSVENDGPWQFSLSRLFAWTTSLSICLGLLSLACRHCHLFHLWPNANHITALAVIVIELTAIILIAPCLAWMRLRFSYISFTFPVIFALLLVILLAYRFFWPALLRPIVTYCGLELLFLVGSLVVLRVAGYRLGFGGGKGSLARNG